MLCYNYDGDFMVYLDYCATTPVSYDVLESYNKATREYMGNANSIHSLGVKSKALLNSAIKQICELFNIEKDELVITSGATESNNMALKGIALSYKNKGNHIIVSKLEHPSIYKICEFLESMGYEISYVNNDSDGLVDFEHLRSLIRPTTILVSICAVNSELGIRQPLKTIRQIIKKENANTVFHSDMTQAIGKVPVNMHDVDLASMSGHKIFGPKGIGFLYRSNKINITPLIHGSGKFNDLRGGTPMLPLIVALSKALRIALTDLEKKEEHVLELNKMIVEHLKEYPNVIVNSTKYSIPHVLNISLMNIRPETFLHALEEEEVFVSTNTACSSGDFSASVMAVTNDKVRASTTIRISLSYVTTKEEVRKFLNVFDVEYNNLIELVQE